MGTGWFVDFEVGFRQDVTEVRGWQHQLIFEVAIRDYRSRNRRADPKLGRTL